MVSYQTNANATGERKNKKNAWPDAMEPTDAHRLYKSCWHDAEVVHREILVGSVDPVLAMKDCKNAA